MAPEAKNLKTSKKPWSDHICSLCMSALMKEALKALIIAFFDLKQTLTVSDGKHQRYLINNFFKGGMMEKNFSRVTRGRIKRLSGVSSLGLLH